MGSGLAKLINIISRPIKNYNIQSRAHKLIENNNISPAPKYKTDEIYYEKILKEHPEILEEHKQKDNELDKNLQSIYVSSFENLDIKQKSNPNRPLPFDRTTHECEYGIKEPDTVPEGRITLRNALQFLSDHQTNAKIYSIPKIAKENIISEEITTNIIRHFRVFDIYIPKKKSKATYAGPSLPKVEIVEKPIKYIENPKKETY